ncbi:unknown protein [Seminavis robusta]|uniref:DDE Tnp4 domain-containing protein n=1 Tax=Seminavis robusta TaxID=568900 RepID=A0A9N8EPS6_9STRA|nr:unknown protein [Seminavis robusta]|eukprot:Sro1356_g265680.1 n/a (144) ;mRNA; r:9582-10013
MRAFPTALTIAKVTAMVRCLCRLHNFCINERLERMATNSQVDSPSEECTEEMAERLASDEMNIVVGEGGMHLDCKGDEYRPTGLLDGGHHFDDVSYWSRAYRKKKNGETLPRELMHETIQLQGLQRPTPKHWVGNTPARSYQT